MPATPTTFIFAQEIYLDVGSFMITFVIQLFSKCGWLNSKHQLTNQVLPPHTFTLVVKWKITTTNKGKKQKVSGEEQPVKYQ